MVENGVVSHLLPVSCTNVASVVGRYTTNVDDYTEDHEANTGDNFQQAKSEFDLSRLVEEINYSW